MWQPPIEGLQLGGSIQRLRLDADLALTPTQLSDLKASGALPETFAGPLRLKIPATLGVVSAEYSVHDWLLAAEYSRWHVGLDSAVTAFDAPTAVSERMYVLAAYHVNSWFTPGVYYSLLFPNVDDRSGKHAPYGAPPGSAAVERGAYQHDVALTMRYDLNAYWLLKVEGHYMHGTAGLTSALNDNRPLSALTRDWAVLLVKTTAYF
jgi:hypothetical protein